MRIIILILVALAASFVFPWWILAVISAICYYIYHAKIPRSILEAFIAGLILYGCMALWQDGNVERSAALLIGGILGDLPAFAGYAITALIGGITAALGAWVGSVLRNTVHTTRTN